MCIRDRIGGAYLQDSDGVIKIFWDRQGVEIGHELCWREFAVVDCLNRWSVSPGFGWCYQGLSVLRSVFSVQCSVFSVQVAARARAWVAARARAWVAARAARTPSSLFVHIT